MKKLLVTAAALGLTLAFVASASATNGYFSHGYSIKSKGMAGAGVAAPMDAMVPATNPAGLTEVGNRLDVGLTIFNPNREYNVNRNPESPNGFELMGGTVDSDKDFFFIPNIGYSSQINENSAWGIAVYGNGGMNTDYPTGSAGLPMGNTFYDPYSSSTGVDLMQLFIAPTYAHKFAENHSLALHRLWQSSFLKPVVYIISALYQVIPTNLPTMAMTHPLDLAEELATWANSLTSSASAFPGSQKSTWMN